MELKTAEIFIFTFTSMVLLFKFVCFGKVEGLRDPPLGQDLEVHWCVVVS
jgi:hypothetical protein